MATKVKTPPTISGQGQFLIARHSGEGIMVYEGNVGDQHITAVLNPGVETVVDDLFLKYSPFVGDFQKGTIALRRSDEVPGDNRPRLADEFILSDTQKALAYQITDGAGITDRNENIVFVHRLLVQGRAPRGVSVSAKFVREEHLPFLRATLDLERRNKNRAKVVKALGLAVKEAEAI